MVFFYGKMKNILIRQERKSKKERNYKVFFIPISPNNPVYPKKNDSSNE